MIFRPMPVELLTSGSRAGKMARLLEDYRIPIAVQIGKVTVRPLTITDGFVTDFASVPEFAYSVVSPLGRHMLAAVAHDFLYWRGTYGRKVSDRYFLYLMTCLGVKPWRRQIMYAAVRAFGGGAWKKHRRGKYPHGEGTPADEGEPAAA